MKKTIAEIETELSFMSLLCNLEFILTYIAAPLLALKFGFLVVVLPAAAQLILLSVFITISFHKKHRIYFPENREARVTADIKMLVCPPTSIRAKDMMTAGFFHDRHPLALAAAALDPPAFAEYARDALNDLRHPLAEEAAGAEELDTVRWYSARMLEASERLVRGTAGNAEEIFAAPERKSAEDEYYCPRCGCEYATPPGEDCPDCAGVKLEKFGDKANH